MAGLVGGGVSGTVAALHIGPEARRAAVTMMSRLIPTAVEEVNGRLLRLELPDRYDRRMAYDEDLATRIRDLIGPDPELTEKKMFGGLAFLIRGHMAISASGQGGVLVHVDPAQSAGLAATTTATTAVMQGREMPGWLRVRPADLTGDDALSQWVDIGIEHARSLPPKQPASRKPKR